MTFNAQSTDSYKSALRQISYAPLTRFRAPTSSILFGQPLNDVKQMEVSIQTHGLLSPLRVLVHKGKFIVIDGRKRLTALRRMRFKGELPRNLQTIPYVLNAQTNSPQKKYILHGRQIYNQITHAKQQGVCVEEIAGQLYLPSETILDILKVRYLSPTLKSAFFNDNLSLAQIKAFSVLPSHDAQDALLIALGPFAQADDILNAIMKGETVLSLSDDNIIILPSCQSGNYTNSPPEKHAA